MANPNPLPNFRRKPKKQVTFNLAANTTHIVDTRWTQPASPPHEIEYDREDNLKGNFLDTLKGLNRTERGTDPRVAVNLAPIRFAHSKDPDEIKQATLVAFDNAKWNAKVALGDEAFAQTEVEHAMQKAVLEQGIERGFTDAGQIADNARNIALLEELALKLERDREQLFSQKFKEKRAQDKEDAANERKKPQTLRDLIDLAAIIAESDREKTRILVEQDLVQRYIRDQERFRRGKGPQFHPLRKVEVELPKVFPQPDKPLENPPPEEKFTMPHRDPRKNPRKNMSEADQQTFDDIMAGVYDRQKPEAGGERDEEPVPPATNDGSPGNEPPPRDDALPGDGEAPRRNYKPPSVEDHLFEENIPKVKLPPGNGPAPNGKNTPTKPSTPPKEPEVANPGKSTESRGSNHAEYGDVLRESKLTPVRLQFYRSGFTFKAPIPGIGSPEGSEQDQMEEPSSYGKINQRHKSPQRPDSFDYHLRLKPSFFKHRLEDLFPDPLSLPQSQISKIGEIFNSMADKESVKYPNWAGLNVEAPVFLDWFFHPMLQLQSILALELKTPVSVPALLSILVAAGSIYWHLDDTVDILLGMRREDPYPRAAARLNDRLGGL